MIYYVSGENAGPGSGTENDPFRTIQQAANVARAGDRVVIGKGVYREWVDPLYGGRSARERVTYAGAEGETPVISGAEAVTGWERTPDGLWKKELDDAFFGSCHPFKTVVSGDWYDDFGQTHHTGEVYLNGKALYEAAIPEALKHDASGDGAYRWYGEAADGKTVLWCNFQDVDPNGSLVEVNARPFCFFPRAEGVNYITVTGLWFRQAATQWAPPTAFQEGALGVNWSKGWLIENCIVSQSKCSGISIGKRRDPTDNVWSRDSQKGGAQTYTEIIFSNLKNGWSKDRVGGHIIRNNTIFDCGQTGIVGNMGGAFSVISGNHIHDINTRSEFGGAEIAGIKLHSAIDAVIADNCIHDCRRGLWLDWQAQGVRVSRNAFFANAVHDLFIEVCHGPCIIDDNLFLSGVSLLNVSQGTAFVHNLFAGRLEMHSDTKRFTLYHLPHDTFVGGVMTIYGGDDRAINNIYVGKADQEGAYGNCVYNGFSAKYADRFLQPDDRPMTYIGNTLPVDIHDNLYLNGARPYRNERNATEAKDTGVRFAVVERDGDYYLTTNLFDAGWGARAALVTSRMLGKAFESDACYENADGTDLTVDKDFSGDRRNGKSVLAGPFGKPFTELLLNRKPCEKQGGEA